MGNVRKYTNEEKKGTVHILYLVSFCAFKDIGSDPDEHAPIYSLLQWLRKMLIYPTFFPW